MAADGALEAALAKTEEQVDAALITTASVTRELKKAKTGSARGQLRDLRRALSAAAGLAAEAARPRRVPRRHSTSRSGST